MVVIVDYGMGNLGSIANMLRRIGAEASISADAAVIAGAEKLILPGVGAFDQGMQNLEERGLIAPLEAAVKRRRVPIVGLCLGMQLFTEGSEEGRRSGLGWIRGRTVRFRLDGATAPAGGGGLKVPHMGWNVVTPKRPHRLLAGAAADARYYFVHSFHLACDDPEEVVGETEYGCTFPSVVASGNVLGLQFHPEKSHRFGMHLLRNFVAGC